MSDENTGADASRYFPKTEIVEAMAEGAVKKRRGRKPKARHDAPEVIVDGDFGQELALRGEDPKFEYAWLSERDRAMLQWRGYEVCLWGAQSCEPKYHYGQKARNTEIKMRELTLHRIPKVRIAAIRARERSNHDRAMDSIRAKAQVAQLSVGVTSA